MTEATRNEVNTVSADEVGMTDHDIQHLLLEAENRLRAQDDASELISFQNTPSNVELLNVPKLSSDNSLQPYVNQQGDIATADTARIVNGVPEKSPHGLPSEPKSSKNTTKKDKPTAGSNWFNLPKTELTPELKRDLQILRMRSVLDPKRHYKKENGKVRPPEYSQVGTIIEGPTEFFSGRIAKKDRNKTFVEEALALERDTKRFESKYRDIQATKQSGKKSFYKNLRSKRNGKGK